MGSFHQLSRKHCRRLRVIGYTIVMVWSQLQHHHLPLDHTITAGDNSQRDFLVFGTNTLPSYWKLPNGPHLANQVTKWLQIYLNDISDWLSWKKQN